MCAQQCSCVHEDGRFTLCWDFVYHPTPPDQLMLVLSCMPSVQLLSWTHEGIGTAGSVDRPETVWHNLSSAVQWMNCVAAALDHQRVRFGC